MPDTQQKRGKKERDGEREKERQRQTSMGTIWHFLDVLFCAQAQKLLLKNN